jgi:DNA-binding transcriptional LysR family regulator
LEGIKEMTESELLYIKTIVEEKSISRAAEKLFISEPSLSKCIRKIEFDLGTKFFVRRGTGLVPTLAGEEYYKVANEILKIYGDFKNEVCDINNLKKGKLILGTTRYLATYLLPIILPAYKEKYPNIEIDLIEENSFELKKTLLSGELDLAIMHMSPLNELSSNTKLEFIILLKDPFLLATRKQHPLKKYSRMVNGLPYPEVDIKRFIDEPFILIRNGQKIREVSELIFQRANFYPHNVTLVTKSFETARRLACMGMGVTFVPLQYSRLFGENFQCDYYCIEDKYSPFWTLGIAIKRNSYTSRATKAMIQIIEQSIGNN